jgi:protein-S-isoprenylcysteine O-methyltransferase Ste14
VALQLTLAAWGVFELGVRVREHLGGRGRAGRDRGTRTLIAITLGAAIALALGIGARSAGPRDAGAYSLGIIVVWLGLAIRVWAIVALGRAFRTTVEVDSGQPIVSTGPYRWVRHPSYVGLLLIVIGCSLAAGNWLALAVCPVLPLPALLWRIHVEEAELIHVLGDRYRAYQAHTKRLIPGVW